MSVTGKQMCNKISDYFYKKTGIYIKPKDIWNYSPTGELSMVFELYNQVMEDER